MSRTMKYRLPKLSPATMFAIEWLWNRFPKEYTSALYMPVLSWMESSTRENLAPGISIGAELRSNVPDELIIRQDGLEIAVGLPKEILEQFGDHTVCYRDRKFFFRKDD